MKSAYLIALDTPKAGGNRLMAKMLAMSLIRSQFDGDILIFRSSTVPIFHLPRPGVVEVQLPEAGPGSAGRSLAQEAWSWKYRVRHALGGGLKRGIRQSSGRWMNGC